MRTMPMCRDETWAVRPGRRGLALRSQRGTLLVTQEGDPLDHVLEAGEEFTTTRRGLVVVWALSAGALAVDRSPAAKDAPVAEVQVEVQERHLPV